MGMGTTFMHTEPDSQVFSCVWSHRLGVPTQVGHKQTIALEMLLPWVVGCVGILQSGKSSLKPWPEGELFVHSHRAGGSVRDAVFSWGEC